MWYLIETGIQIWVITMSDQELPPGVDALGGISDRLQDYNQKVQEQAFLLGYRNGFREGDMMQGLLAWVREAQADPDITQDRLDTLRDVEHYLASNGAFLDDEGEGEVTYPPGLNTYIGAFDATPMIQVAGERIHIEDFQFDWKPNPHAESVDDFEPHRETATIEFSVDLELPRDSEQRAELMQFLEGLR